MAQDTLDERTQAKVAASSATKTPITDVREQGLIEAMQQIDPLLAKYPEAAAGTDWSLDTETLTVRVTDLASPLVAALEALDLPVKLKTVTVPYSTATLVAVIEELYETRSQWAKGLPAWGYAAASEEKGAILIGVDRSQTAAWQAAINSLDMGVPIRLVTEKSTNEVFENRVTDSIPWSGGIKIEGAYYSGVHPGSIAHCTAGFTWRRWSGLGNAASTAEHCINFRDEYGLTTYLPWANAGAVMGSPVRTSPASDSALLQYSGQSYSASTFVGGVTSNDLRSVVAAASSDESGSKLP